MYLKSYSYCPTITVSVAPSRVFLGNGHCCEKGNLWASVTEGMVSAPCVCLSVGFNGLQLLPQVLRGGAAGRCPPWLPGFQAGLVRSEDP